MARSSSMSLYVRRDRTDYLGRGAQDGHVDFHTAPELCKFEFNVALRPQRPYGLFGTVTLTFTQLLSSMNSSSMLLYVHTDHKDYLGRGAQDGHLDFHRAPEL